MSRKPWNPLAMIPSPEAIRERLAETEELAEKLRVLLGVSEEINRKKESPSKPDLTPPSAALLPSPVMLRARLAIALREVALVRRLISAAESVRPPKPNA